MGCYQRQSHRGALVARVGHRGTANATDKTPATVVALMYVCVISSILLNGLWLHRNTYITIMALFDYIVALYNEAICSSVWPKRGN